MKAINYYLVVENIKEGMKDVGGLLLTEELDSDNRYLKGTVMSAGNLVEGIKDGDVVYYDKHAGHGVHYKETLYYVIRNVDVVLID